MSSKSYFDEVATRWDAMRQTFYSEQVREKAYQAASPKPGQLAADVGAGTGFITEGLLARGVQVIAVDQSEAMLAEMMRKFADSDAVAYRLGGAESLPIPDATVDHAFANMYLHHVESPAEAIREMARIVRPGGRLVITDLDAHTHDYLLTEHHDRWLGFEREDVRRWFVEAGLQDVSVSDVGESCTSESCCGDQPSSISIFIAAGAKPARDRQLRRTHGTVNHQHAQKSV